MQKCDDTTLKCGLVLQPLDGNLYLTIGMDKPIN